MDKTARISFSKSFDLAGQNKLVKDPGQLYIAKTVNIGRFLADVWSILGFFGDLFGIFWRSSGSQSFDYSESGSRAQTPIIRTPWE